MVMIEEQCAYLLSSFAPLEGRVLERANAERSVDSSLAALGRRSIGSNALLNSLGEGRGREKKRSEDGGSAHGEDQGSLTRYKTRVCRIVLFVIVAGNYETCNVRCSWYCLQRQVVKNTTRAAMGE